MRPPQCCIAACRVVLQLGLPYLTAMHEGDQRSGKMIKQIRVEMTMSTHTPTFSVHDFATTRERRADKPGFFARAFEAYSDAMIATARARAARELFHLSDDHLGTLGMTPEQIVALRKSGTVPASFWDR